MDEKDLQITENSEVKERTLSFMQETIKEKPVNKRRLFRRTMITAFSALIFGAVACFTFLVLEPVISNRLYPEEITKVTFPEEEEEIMPEEMLTESVVQEELQADILQQVEEMAAQEQPIEFNAKSYEQIFNSMYQVSCVASKFMVTVKGTVSGVDWLQDTYEKENVVSGAIIADNGVEYLIIADITRLTDSETYSVTFWNGRTAEAVLKEKHTTTGIGVFAVRHDDFTEDEKNIIMVATLGNSNVGANAGKPVMAIGRPTGREKSLMFGMICANTDNLYLPDGTYQLLDTDMQILGNVSGVLINLQKEVVGMITSQSMDNDENACISAIGISDLKQIIEKLSNGEKIPYSGLKGMDVTKEAHKESNVPYGAYITEAEMQSPAMKAGVLNGDIITQTDETVLASFEDYKHAILKKKPGDVVTLHVKRFTGEGYRDMEITITLGECK